MALTLDRIRAPIRSASTPRRLTAALFCAALLLAWFVYRPGLHGDFLFDDYANLPALGAYGPVDNAATFWRYITSGSADPTGRPLALLSFLLDARNWPAEPYPFKRTSVLLHLLNGCLLYVLLLQLGKYVGTSDSTRRSAAVLGTALWLLHPLFVSTTLYVVQREAMLPAFFIMLGLAGYVRGHELALSGRIAGIVLASTAIAVCTVLAMLSKANGALLPLFAWIVDAILLKPRSVMHARTSRGMRWVKHCMLVLPSAMLFAYLIYQAIAGMTRGILAERPWTLGERLLTEPRVVVDYLGLLWFPRPYSTGLFNDSVVVSTGWFTPPGTLPCILAIGALLVFAFAARRQHPALAAAVVFYFAGQLLESTSIPLELYFEHRNYLPAMLMFWPLALWLCGRALVKNNPGPPTHNRAAGGLRGVRIALSILLPLGLAALTYLRADLWGNRDDQALLWGEKNVHSPRAQAYAAQIESARGHRTAGIARLQLALIEHPDDIQLALNLVGMKCSAGTLTQADLEHAKTALRSTLNVGRLGYEWFEQALPAVREKRCSALDLAAVQSLLAAAWENPTARATFGRRQDLINLQARLALMQQEPDRALRLFDSALDADPRPGAALQQATTLARAGFPALALRHLDHLEAVWKPPTHPAPRMPAIHAWLLWREGYWQHEIAHLRGVLEDDLRSSTAPAAPAIEIR
jgi:hypothetical protein